MTTKVTNEIDFKNQLSQQDKEEITAAIILASESLGSDTAVANKCGVSPAAISQIKAGQYLTKGEDMWRKIAAALKWQRSGFITVEDLTNTRIMLSVLKDAYHNSMFMGVAARAGMGKTTGINIFLQKNTRNVFHLECWKWSPREFLVKLGRSVGVAQSSTNIGYITVNDMLDQLINYFKKRPEKAMIILDQANSLPHTTKALIIYMYNELKGKLGMAIVGTENLEQQLERGIKNRHHGHDEIFDRIGRGFIHLIGYTYNDVKKMCVANGIKTEDVIKQIWNESMPTSATISEGDGFKEIRMVPSGRVVERKIMKYNMLAAMLDNSQLAKTA